MKSSESSGDLYERRSASEEGQQSPAPGLIDRFGRVADDLRISVTDRCNFRCVYCMPADGLPWMPKSHLLSFEEIARIARVFVSLGVRTIRLTGGEPTLRRELPTLVSMLSDIHPRLDLAMTTNGFLLKDLANPLARAGLKRVNVSVDSLLDHRFEQITRRNALSGVMEGIRAAEEANLGPVKINCVVVRGTNDDELLDFARLARDTGWQIRFIEYMPLDAERTWDRSKVVSQAEIVEAIGAAYPLEAATASRKSDPDNHDVRGSRHGDIKDLGQAEWAQQDGRDRGRAELAAKDGRDRGQAELAQQDGRDRAENGVRGPDPRPEPASVWKFADGAPGSIGVIPSVSAPFCSSCNRLRITADGQLRTCLFSLGETDLKVLMRRNESDAALAAVIERAVWRKEPGHRINEADFKRPERSMSMIGG